MKTLDMKALSMDARPFLWKDGTILMVRPYPRIKQDAKFKAEGMVIILSGQDQYDRFTYCLVDWKKAALDGDGNPILEENGSPVIDVDGMAVAGTDGNAVKLTENVKKAVFNANWEGIVDFVIQKSREAESLQEQAEKN